MGKGCFLAVPAPVFERSEKGEEKRSDTNIRHVCNIKSVKVYLEDEK